MSGKGPYPCWTDSGVSTSMPADWVWAKQQAQSEATILMSQTEPTYEKQMPYSTNEGIEPALFLLSPNLPDHHAASTATIPAQTTVSSAALTCSRGKRPQACREYTVDFKTPNFCSSTFPVPPKSQGQSCRH